MQPSLRLLARTAVSKALNKKSSPTSHPFLLEEATGAWTCSLLLPASAHLALEALIMPPATPSTTSKANSVENPTVPPAYVCYILRSKSDGKYNNRTYVGSTPDPPRRFRQHNRDIKGGAFRTKMYGPWEMEAFVYGFPNKLSALQFEWAWDKAEKTHWLVVPAEEGEDPLPTSPKKPKKATKKKTLALSDGTKEIESESVVEAKRKTKKSAVIHLFPKGAATGVARTIQRFAAMQRLLVTPPFSNFKLGVYLFSAEAEKWWQTALSGVFCGGWADKPANKGSARRLAHEGAKRAGPVDCSAIAVNVRHSGPDGKRREREKGVAYGNEKDDGEGLLDVTDKLFAEQQWVKWQGIADDKTHNCACCGESLDVINHLDVALCPSEGCAALSHLTCLACHYLAPQASSSKPILLPAYGDCPACCATSHWQDVARSCWRRHELATAPPKAKRGKKKAVEMIEEEEEMWDSSENEDLAPPDMLDEGDDAHRAVVEEMEKEASFDAGYLWQPDDEQPAQTPDSTSSSASSKRTRSASPSRSIKSGVIELSSDSAPSSPSKRRRKTSSSSDELPSLTNGVVNESPPRRPRGRPKKVVLSSTPKLPSPTSAIRPSDELHDELEAMELSSPAPAKRAKKTVIELSSD